MIYLIVLDEQRAWLEQWLNVGGFEIWQTPSVEPEGQVPYFAIRPQNFTDQFVNDSIIGEDKRGGL